MRNFKNFVESRDRNLTEMHHSDFGAAAAMPEPARQAQLAQAVQQLDALAMTFQKLLFHQNPQLADLVLSKFQDIKSHLSGAVGG